jgi:hypothetical protein
MIAQLLKLLGYATGQFGKIIKPAPADVLTTQEADRLLAPFIKPLPPFDEMVAGKGRGSTRARVEDGRLARGEPGAVETV